MVNMIKGKVKNWVEKVFFFWRRWPFYASLGNKPERYRPLLFLGSHPRPHRHRIYHRREEEPACRRRRLRSSRRRSCIFLSLCISISLLRPYTFFSRSPLVFKTLFENACEIQWVVLRSCMSTLTSSIFPPFVDPVAIKVWVRGYFVSRYVPYTSGCVGYSLRPQAYTYATADEASHALRGNTFALFIFLAVFFFSCGRVHLVIRLSPFFDATSKKKKRGGDSARFVLLTQYCTSTLLFSLPNFSLCITGL